MPKKNVCYDHLGNQYKSFTVMCKAYNKSASTVQLRIDKGWPLEEALTKENQITTAAKMCYDHLGNQYESFLKMCQAYNKNYVTVKGRIKKGWSLKDALTKENNQMCIPKACKDHLGNSYESFAQMCQTYNKSSMTVRGRIKQGWSLKDALTKENNTFFAPKTCMDHLGNQYKSFEQMCKAYNKTTTVVKYRLKKGWTLKAALTENAKVTPISISIFNVEYNSINKAANSYNIASCTVKFRFKNKWDMELAFVYPTTAPLIQFCYVGIDGKTRYKMGNNIYTTEELIARYAPEYLELYRKTNPEGIHHLYEEIKK